MAIVSTYNTDFVTQAEDVDDYLSQVDAVATPFLASLGRQTAEAKRVEPIHRAYRAPKDNAQLEAGDAPTPAVNLPIKGLNYTQTFSDTAEVTKSAEAVRSYGISKMLGDQIEEQQIGQRRDIEYAMTGIYTAIASDEVAVAPTDETAFTDATREGGKETAPTIPGRMASVFGLIDSTLADTNAGTPRALTELMLNQATQGLYEATKESKSRIALLKPADMLIVADIATAGTDGGRLRDIGNSDELYNYVKYYMTPFGRLECTPSTVIGAEAALIYDPAMADVRTLYPMDFERVDAGTMKVSRVEISCELTLTLSSPFSAAWIGDLSTA